jgi:N-(2-amino-2-carboxyethyl)-L-glutamate synthase
LTERSGQDSARGAEKAWMTGTQTSAISLVLQAHDGILSTVGHTPLVRLTRLFPDNRIEILAKLEAHNPGGSMKDRPALRMVRDGLRSGRVQAQSLLVESSSGNLAIGLAQVCAALGLRLRVVVDPKVTQTNLKILRAYGAEIDMVGTPDPETGEYLAARQKRVAELVATVPHAVHLNQYANPENPGAHREGTVAELLDSLNNRVDWLVVAISTCGTLRGARQAIAERGLSTRILAVDAAGSVIFGKRGTRLLPGHGAGTVPGHMADGLADEAALVTDVDCVAGCRALVAREAILAGASSGGVVAVLNRYRHVWPAKTRVAVVLPDRGDRYLDTVYDDSWCERHLGSVPELDAQVAAPVAAPTSKIEFANTLETSHET